VTRIALAPAEPVVRDLAGALRAAGQDAVVLGRPAPAAERLLGRRGFTAGLAHLPLMAPDLMRGGFDIVHAFAAPDAALAIRLGGAPVVFTCTEVLDRAALAGGRVRLRTLQRAVECSDAVLVPGERERDALRRWMAADARIVDPRDAEAQLSVYRELARG
jgi:hypothetical protein